MWYLGVDPGRSGAAVALAPDIYAEVLWSWRTQDDGTLIVRIAQHTEEGVRVRKTRVPSPHALGQLILTGLVAVAGAEQVQVAHEAVHVGKNARTAIQQAYWLGQVMGPLVHTVGQARELRPTEWRKAVGVNARLKGPAVKADAVRALTGSHPELAELVSALERKSALAHDFEAGGVAVCLAGSKS